MAKLEMNVSAPIKHLHVCQAWTSLWSALPMVRLHSFSKILFLGGKYWIVYACATQLENYLWKRKHMIFPQIRAFFFFIDVNDVMTAIQIEFCMFCKCGWDSTNAMEHLNTLWDLNLWLSQWATCMFEWNWMVICKNKSEENIICIVFLCEHCQNWMTESVRTLTDERIWNTMHI